MTLAGGFAIVDIRFVLEGPGGCEGLVTFLTENFPNDDYNITSDDCEKAI